MEPAFDGQPPTSHTRPTLSSATSAFAKGLATGVFIGWVGLVVMFPREVEQDIPLLGCANVVIAATIQAGIGGAVFVIALMLRLWLTGWREAAPHHRPALLAGIACAVLGMAAPVVMPDQVNLTILIAGLVVLACVAAMTLPLAE